MIVRLLGLMIAGAVAYLMLRGWPGWLPDLLRACLAVLALVLALGWWTSGKQSAKHDLPTAQAARKPGWLDFLSIGLGLLVVECAFLWILSAAPEPLEQFAITMEEQFRPEAAERRAKLATGTQVSGNWLWQEEGRRVLPNRTDLKPGPKPEVFVRLVNAEDAEEMLKRQVYVRSFAMSRFEKGVWSGDEGDVKTLRADGDGWIRIGDSSEQEILHEVFVGKGDKGRDVFTALQGARAVRLPSLRVVSEGISYLPEVGEVDGYEYLASSVSLRLSDLPVSARAAEMSDFTAVDGRIERLGQRIAGEGALLDKLRRIEAYLKENYVYSLRTENKQDLDPMENFLFEEKRGHCEFFATAAALMAKGLGAEVRVAYGWAGGQFFDANNTFVFRARDAHAWVEVKAENNVWIVMDPTPPIAFGGNEKPNLADAGETLPDLDEIFEDEESAFGSDRGNLPQVALILTATFGVAMFVVFLLRTKLPEAMAGATAVSIEGRRDAGYISAWRRAFKKRSASSSQGTTLRCQIRELESAPMFADELLEYHYAVRYEQRLPDRKVERELERQIRLWEETRE